VEELMETKKMTEKEVLEKVAEDWKDYVRKEISAYLDSFLDIASEGNIGVKYKHYVISTYENGRIDYDKNQAIGVQLLLDFKFETPLFFTDENGVLKE